MDKQVAQQHPQQQPPQQHLGALRSSIAWALLGLVIERPSYGYELMQRFRRIYGETLVLSNPARVYIALQTLSAHLLIEEVADADQPDLRQPKPRYRATEHGVRSYQDWLLTQLEEARQRQRLFARQLAMLEPEAALGVIDQYERECLQDNEPPEPDSERQGVAARLAEEDENLGLQVRLSWIEYARGELTALLQQRSEEGDQA